MDDEPKNNLTPRTRMEALLAGETLTMFNPNRYGGERYFLQMLPNGSFLHTKFHDYNPELNREWVIFDPLQPLFPPKQEDDNDSTN